MKRLHLALLVFLIIFATSVSQDSWETYEDSEEYYEYEEPIDLEDAKQYFCSEIKEEFKSCVLLLFEKNLDKYDSCFEKIGLKSESFLEAVDEACLPETPADVGKKFQACKIEIQMGWKKQNASFFEAVNPTNNRTFIDNYIMYCIPFREKVIDEGWMKYFTAGITPL